MEVRDYQHRGGGDVEVVEWTEGGRCEMMTRKKRETQKDGANKRKGNANNEMTVMWMSTRWKSERWNWRE